jgi:CheY-like chemotaxis protein
MPCLRQLKATGLCLVCSGDSVNTDLGGIPVVVVSGRDLRGNKERALKGGAKAFLQKPWDDDELLSLIARLLGQPDIYGQSGGTPVWELDDPAVETPDR